MIRNKNIFDLFTIYFLLISMEIDKPNLRKNLVHTIKASKEKFWVEKGEVNDYVAFTAHTRKHEIVFCFLIDRIYFSRIGCYTEKSISAPIVHTVERI